MTHTSLLALTSSLPSSLLLNLRVSHYKLFVPFLVGLDC